MKTGRANSFIKGRSMQPHSTIWVYFVPVAEIPIRFTPGGANRLDRYLIQEVRSICGEAPSTFRRGEGVKRRRQTDEGSNL